MAQIQEKAPVRPDDADCRLVRDALGGSEGAFEALVHRYTEPVFDLLVRCGAAPDLAEDVLQETWIRVHRHLGRFAHRAAFKTWLYRVALNCFRTRVKARQRETGLAALPVAIGHETTPTSALEGEELRRALQAALDRLPYMQRAAFSLHLHDEMSYAEIAEVLGTSRESARVHLHLARRKLAALLRDHL